MQVGQILNVATVLFALAILPLAVIDQWWLAGGCLLAAIGCRVALVVQGVEDVESKEEVHEELAVLLTGKMEDLMNDPTHRKLLADLVARGTEGSDRFDSPRARRLATEVATAERDALEFRDHDFVARRGADVLHATLTGLPFPRLSSDELLRAFDPALYEETRTLRSR